jgi:iron-sulfur cluster repair protein YtfE (RIC family)
MTLALDPTTLPPALQGWLGAHTAFRRDADALVNAVAAHDPSDTAAAARLADAFAISKRMLDEHHATEDEVVFPELIGRSPAFAGVVMTMSLEHVDLDDVVDDMNRALNVLTAKTSRNEDVHERLVEQTETFRELMNLHLDVEEEYALPMFLRHLTIEEIDSIGDQHLARNADKLDEMIPWVASALTPDASTAMLAGMPQAVQDNFANWNVEFQAAFAPMLSSNAHAVAA